MADTPTKVPLATTTLGSAASSVHLVLFLALIQTLY